MATPDMLGAGAAAVASPAAATSGAGRTELTEAQQKLVEEDAPQTLEQQESMKISGSNARHMVMQRLMRKTEVSASCR